MTEQALEWRGENPPAMVKEVREQIEQARKRLEQIEQEHNDLKRRASPFLDVLGNTNRRERDLG